MIVIDRRPLLISAPNVFNSIQTLFFVVYIYMTIYSSVISITLQHFTFLNMIYLLYSVLYIMYFKNITLKILFNIVISQLSNINVMLYVFLLILIFKCHLVIIMICIRDKIICICTTTCNKIHLSLSTRIKSFLLSCCSENIYTYITHCYSLMLLLHILYAKLFNIIKCGAILTSTWIR